MITISFLMFIQSSNCLSVKNFIKTLSSLFYHRVETDFVSFDNLLMIINETAYKRNESNQTVLDNLRDIIIYDNVSNLALQKHYNIENEVMWTNKSNWTAMKLYQMNNLSIKWNMSENYLNLMEWNSNENSTLNKSLFHSSSTIVNLSTTYPKYYHLYPIEQWKLHHFFKEDYFKQVNSHWFNYPPPSHQMHYIFLSIYLFLMLIGFIGNGLVIFMIISFRSLRTPSNIFVLNLAGSDILILSKIPIFLYNSIHFGPVLGEIGCQLYGFLGGLSGTVSIMTLAAIAVDRYLTIAHPLNKKLRLTKIRIIIWIVFIWTYSAVFALIPLADLGVKAYVPEGFLTSCSFDYLDTNSKNRLFIFIYFLAAWCLPLLMIVTSYTGICREVLNVSLARKGQEREKRKREIKLAIAVALVIAMWFISWTPYAIVALFGITGYADYITPLSSMIPAIFCKTSSAINPFIYALNHPRLRRELQKLFCRESYSFERTQFTLRFWRSIGSRDSCKLKADTSFNKSKLMRKASTTSSQFSIKSVQVLELNAIKSQFE